MTFRAVIKRLNKEGWYEDCQSGSHKIFKHPDKPEARVNVPAHSGDIKNGVLKDIYQKAGWGRP